MNAFEDLGKRLLDGSLSLESFQNEMSILCKSAASNGMHMPGCHSLDENAEYNIDFDRQRRCGFPEVVYGEGKSPESIVRILKEQSQAGIDCLATRVSPEKAAILLHEFPGGHYNAIGRTFRLRQESANGENKADGEDHTKDFPPGLVAILTAGTSDMPVAEEAKETALWTGAQVRLIQDIGVAGPQRLRARFPDFKDADVIIVVAGMEGALPSVVGGYVSVPVIGVPTSVGYGASFGGLAALLGMLNSCASNVTVVNIDAGFKAGYLAGLIARRKRDRECVEPYKVR
ncbi:MAG: nickel pincer cofactor biosynthesis protein LarB [Thermoguttaceae bacterium]|nr:nickel pincer cofactor biosynthesis protein LarB [Thermoguttaceae bacterium]